MPKLIAEDTSYPIQAILFDKDGTLLDFAYTWGYWGEQLLARFSTLLEERGVPAISIDLAEFRGIKPAAEHADSGYEYDRNGPLAMGTIHDLLSILSWQGYRSGLSWADAKLLVNSCRDYADDALEQFKIVKILPGVIDFLEQCRKNGIIMAVVTADETAAARKHLEWLDMAHYFSAVIGTDQVERGKPFPDMVMLACRELSLSCAQVAVIGDTNGDMKMAKSAGVAVAIGIAGTDGDGRALLPNADTVITAYRELNIREGE